MKSLWVAIPDSVVDEQKGLREKTEKIGYIARTCSIFGVDRIFVFSDPRLRFKKDRNLVISTLRYLETPQYLRKKLFPITQELSYAGVLPPLKIPSHKEKKPVKEIPEGEVREAVLEEVKGKLYADVGLDVLIPFDGKGRRGQRVTVKIRGKYPNHSCIPVDKRELREYWGYDVREVGALQKLLPSVNADYVLLTSRYGSPISERWPGFVKRIKEGERILVVMGPPKGGLLELLSKEWIERHGYELMNMIPDQKVGTVRTEEALMITLAITNLADKLSK
jgi:hypothetical protein